MTTTGPCERESHASVSQERGGKSAGVDCSWGMLGNGPTAENSPTSYAIWGVGGSSSNGDYEPSQVPNPPGSADDGAANATVSADNVYAGASAAGVSASACAPCATSSHTSVGCSTLLPIPSPMNLDSATQVSSEPDRNAQDYYRCNVQGFGEISTTNVSHRVRQSPKHVPNALRITTPLESLHLLGREPSPEKIVFVATARLSKLDEIRSKLRKVGQNTPVSAPEWPTDDVSQMQVWTPRVRYLHSQHVDARQPLVHPTFFRDARSQLRICEAKLTCTSSSPTKRPTNWWLKEAQTGFTA